MTQEEKAQAYDEALKRAKFYHGNCPLEPERKKLEEMFPELAYSEDERIRKQLVDIVAFIPEANFKSASREDCRAYLEKQKEQKPASSGSSEKPNNLLWSEENEESFNNALFGLKYAYEDLVNHKSFDSAEDVKNAFYWLKSRRTDSYKNCNSRWKPSDEQMEALESAVKLYKDTHFEIHHKKIVSLYEQLKKLM